MQIVLCLLIGNKYFNIPEPVNFELISSSHVLAMVYGNIKLIYWFSNLLIIKVITTWLYKSTQKKLIYKHFDGRQYDIALFKLILPYKHAVFADDYRPHCHRLDS